MRGLSLGFRVLLENPTFITGNNVLEEAWIIFLVFQGVSRNFHPMFFLLLSEEFWYLLAHTFLMPRFSCRICLTVDFSPIARMLRWLIFSNSCSDILNVIIGFLSRRAAGALIVLSIFPSLFKSLKPPKNLYAINTQYHKLLSTSRKFLWQMFRV